MRMMTPIRVTTKVGEVVRSVPRPAGMTFLVDRAPATARAARMGTKRPKSMATPPSVAEKSV